MKTSNEKYNLFLGEFFYRTIDIPTRENLSNLFLSEFSKEDRDERLQKVILEGKNGFIKNENSFFDITQTFLDKTLGSRFDILSEIKNTFDSKKVSDYSIFDELINIENIKCIFSINYDVAIEKSKKYYEEMETIRPFKVTKDLKAPEFDENDKIHYYKLLGDISNLNDMCITSQDIRRMKMLPFYNEFWTRVRDEILDRPTIFLGMNFNDLDFLDIVDFLFAKIKRLGQPIYLVQANPLFNESVVKLKDKYGMKIICSDEHDFLKNFNTSNASADFLKKKIEILVPYDESSFIVKDRGDLLESNEVSNKSQQKKKKEKIENKISDEKNLSNKSLQEVKGNNTNKNIFETKTETQPENLQEKTFITSNDISEDIVKETEEVIEKLETELVENSILEVILKDSQVYKISDQSNISSENRDTSNAIIKEKLATSDTIAESIINSANEKEKINDIEVNTNRTSEENYDINDTNSKDIENVDINKTLDFITVDSSQLEREINESNEEASNQKEEIAISESEQIIEKLVDKRDSTMEKEVNFVLCENAKISNDQDILSQTLVTSVNIEENITKENFIEESIENTIEEEIIPINFKENTLPKEKLMETIIEENVAEQLEIDKSIDEGSLQINLELDENSILSNTTNIEESLKDSEILIKNDNTTSDFIERKSDENISNNFINVFSNNEINSNFDNIENNLISSENITVIEENINYDLISDELIVENNFVTPEKIGYNRKSEFILTPEKDNSSNEVERLTEDDVIGIDNPTYDDLIAIVSKKQIKTEVEEIDPIAEKIENNEIIFQKIATDNIANQPLIDDTINIEISLDSEIKSEDIINNITEEAVTIDEIAVKEVATHNTDSFNDLYLNEGISDDIAANEKSKEDKDLEETTHKSDSFEENNKTFSELKRNEKIINIEQFKRERFIEKENKESVPYNEILKERLEDTRLPQVHILSGDTNEIEVELYSKYLSLELDHFPIKGSHLLDDVIDDYVSIENLGSSDVMIGDNVLHSARIRMFIRKNTNVIEIKTKEFSLSFGVYDDGSRLLIRSSDIYRYQIFSDLKNSRLTWVANTLKNFFSGSPVIFNSKGYAGTIEYRNEQEVRKFNILLNSIKDYETIVGTLKLNKEKNISEMENSFYTLFLLSSYLHGNRELINFINFNIPNKNNIKAGDYISFERLHKLKFRGITFDLKEVITLKEAVTLGEVNPNTVSCHYKKVGITLAKLEKVQEMLKS